MCTTMPSHRLAEVNLLLRTDSCNTRRTRTHGSIRQVPLRAAHLRIAAACRPVRYQSGQGKTTHAGPASCRHVSETKNDFTESRAQEIPVFAAQRYSTLPESHLVDGHYVHRFDPRICVSYGNHRLVQPDDIVVAIIQHDGRRLLRGLSRRGVRRVRRTGVFQQRSGKSIHLQEISGQI